MSTPILNSRPTTSRFDRRSGVDCHADRFRRRFRGSLKSSRFCISIRGSSSGRLFEDRKARHDELRAAIKPFGPARAGQPARRLPAEGSAGAGRQTIAVFLDFQRRRGCPRGLRHPRIPCRPGVYSVWLTVDDGEGSTRHAAGSRSAAIRSPARRRGSRPGTSRRFGPGRFMPPPSTAWPVKPSRARCGSRPAVATGALRARSISWRALATVGKLVAELKSEKGRYRGFACSTKGLTTGNGWMSAPVRANWPAAMPIASSRFQRHESGQPGLVSRGTGRHWRPAAET